MKTLRPALSLLLLFTILTGLIYPLFVTAFAQQFFPWRADGSIVQKNNKPLGSLYIGQTFTDPSYFWGRPSSESNLSPTNPLLYKVIQERIQLLQQSNSIPVQYKPKNKGSGILIPETLSPDIEVGLEANAHPTTPVVHKFILPPSSTTPAPLTPTIAATIPVDLVTDSASGVDPDISPEAAFYQVPRVAHARNLPPAEIRALVVKCIQSRTGDILGEPRVNVLELNLALDALSSTSGKFA